MPSTIGMKCAGSAVLAAILSCSVGTSARADVVISTDQTQNMTCAAGVCAPTAASAVLNVTDLGNLLASGAVEVTTTGSGVQANNIDVTSAVSWSASNALALDAHRSIAFSATVASGGTGGISLTARGGEGGLAFTGGNITFANTSNQLTINGKSYSLVASIAQLASAIQSNPHGKFALANSYDASQDGTYVHSPIQTTFTGAFDGLGNDISNLTIADTTDEYVGFFSQLGSLGTINDFGLTSVNLNLTGNSTAFGAGALVGYNEGSSNRVFASGTVLGCGVYVGGLIGINTGKTFASSANVVVSAASTNCAEVGGLAGGNSGVISWSSESGEVDGGGGDAGGLVWSNNGLVEHSYATGRVNSTPSTYGPYVGGLVAENDGWITTSYATGAASGINKKANLGAGAIGGLVGYNIAVINLSFATGSVSGGTSSAVGGFVGYDGLEQDSDLRITDCYATGAARGGNAAYVGGFVGLQVKSYALHAVTSSYSTGASRAKKGEYPDYVGGFAGGDYSNNSIVKSYWDTTTSSKKAGTGNRGNEPGLKGLTTSKFQSGLPAGFNSKTWTEDANINDGLPYLIDNPPPQ